MSSNDPESCAGGSVATGRASHAGVVPVEEGNQTGLGTVRRQRAVLWEGEDGGSEVLRNVGILSQHYVASHNTENLDLNFHRRENLRSSSNEAVTSHHLPGNRLIILPREVTSGISN